jgi:hypothetical protein
VVRYATERFDRLSHGLATHLRVTFDREFLVVGDLLSRTLVHNRYFFWFDGPPVSSVEEEASAYLASHGCGERRGRAFSIAGKRQLVHCRRKTSELLAAQAVVTVSEMPGRTPLLNRPRERDLFISVLDETLECSSGADLAHLVVWFTDDCGTGFKRWKAMARTIDLYGGFDGLQHTFDALMAPPGQAAAQEKTP